MGFLAPVEADKVQAVYRSLTKQLFLSAEGTVRPVTSRITFTPVEPWVGGLKFILEGWTGPLIPPNSEPYHVDQPFDIQLPNSAFPSNTVDVVTLNHPEGLVVPIQYVDAGPGPVIPPYPPKIQQAASSAAGSGKADLTTTPAQPQSFATTDDEIFVIYDRVFTVKEATNLPSMGTIFMDYDSNFLKVENASLEAGNLVWSFNSLQLGKTQIRVRIHGGIAQFAFTKVYNVHINLDNHAAEAKASHTAVFGSAAATNGADSNGDMDLPVSFPYDTFLGRVNQAIHIVKTKFPDAGLSFVDARPITDGYVTNPEELSHILCTFNASLDGKEGIATIETAGWWGWYPPRWTAPFSSVKRPNIPWPVKIDALEADKLLKQEGHKEPYNSMFLLQNSVLEGVDALMTAYEFHLKDGDFVAVEADEKAIPKKSGAT
jgi:hypothetical protein